MTKREMEIGKNNSNYNFHQIWQHYETQRENKNLEWERKDTRNCISRYLLLLFFHFSSFPSFHFFIRTLDVPMFFLYKNVVKIRAYSKISHLKTIYGFCSFWCFLDSFEFTLIQKERKQICSFKCLCFHFHFQNTILPLFLTCL